MFDCLKAHPVFTTRYWLSVEEAVRDFILATDGAQPVRWLEFPSAVLLCVTATNDPNSGAFFVLDRKRGVWLWIDFDDEAYGGYSGNDFDRLVHDYDLLSLVERPALLSASPAGYLSPENPPRWPTKPDKQTLQPPFDRNPVLEYLHTADRPRG